MKRFLATLAILAFSTAIAAQEARQFSAFGTTAPGDRDTNTIAGWLEQATKARSDTNRSNAISALCNIGRQNASRLDEAEVKEVTLAIKICFKSTKSDDSRSNLLSAATSLRSPELIPEATDCLATAQCQNAISALEAIGDPASSIPILKVAQDIKRDEDVRRRAIHAVGIIGTNDTFKALEKMHDKEKNQRIKEALARALDALEKRLKEAP